MILQTYAAHVAGALLEEKDFALAFHYRRCDAELSFSNADFCLNTHLDVRRLLAAPIDGRRAGANWAAGCHGIEEPET